MPSWRKLLVFSGPCHLFYAAAKVEADNKEEDELGEVDESLACEECGSRTRAGEMLLCDNCDAAFHMGCLDPPLTGKLQQWADGTSAVASSSWAGWQGSMLRMGPTRLNNCAPAVRPWKVLDGFSMVACLYSMHCIVQHQGFEHTEQLLLARHPASPSPFFLQRCLTVTGSAVTVTPR